MAFRFSSLFMVAFFLAQPMVCDLHLARAQETAGEESSPTTPAIPAREQPFWDSAQAFVDAYANRDAVAIGNMFTEDAEFLDEFGELTEGREAITALFALVFETHQDAIIEEIQILRVRFFADNVAMEEGFVISSEEPGEPTHRSRYVAVHTKGSDGKWLINTLKDFPRQPAGRQEQLSQLAWLVGDWVNEDEQSVVHTICDWSPDGNYLMRKFTMQLHDGREMDGVQRIGWDPALKKLRSWTFDSEGGFFHGLWTQDGNIWLLNLSGVTAEGESVTATLQYTVVDAEMLIWNFQSLIIGGEVQAEAEPVTMVKRPPAPLQALSQESNNDNPTGIDR